MSGKSTEQLVERILKNDRGLLSELRLMIEKIAAKWNWYDTGVIDDIAQECFVKLLENLQAGKFKGDASLKTYVYAIARYTCIDHYKARIAVRSIPIEDLELVDGNPLPGERLIAREERQTAYRVLMSLPKKCRTLWRVIFFGKRTYKEAAEVLASTEGTIKRRMWECRKIARDSLKKLQK